MDSIRDSKATKVIVLLLAKSLGFLLILLFQEGVCGAFLTKYSEAMGIRQQSAFVAWCAVGLIFVMNLIATFYLSSRNRKTLNFIALFIGFVLSFWLLGGWYALEKAVRRGW